MPYYHQSWFWVGIFTLVGSLGGILIKELISARSQAKLERLRLYESDIFKAYNNLYQFVSSSSDFLWPPNAPQQDFRDLMTHRYFKNVKKDMLFYSSEIREILEKLEAQYDCLMDPDLIPEKTFDEFYKEDLYKLMRSLEKAVEKRIDPILHKGLG